MGNWCTGRCPIAAIGIFAALFLMPLSMEGRKQKLRLKATSEKSNEEKPMKDTGSLLMDSLANVYRDSIRFSGFDKIASSKKESVFVSNNSIASFRLLLLTISYHDLEGRQLHSRIVKINTDLPAGETRKIDFPSFDTQGAFYYYKSNAPRRRATPFKVKIQLTGIE